MSSEVPVREIAGAEIPAAAAVLARAFHADPMWAYILPDESTRGSQLARMAESWISCARRYGKAWVTPGLEGVALRRAPGYYDLGLWRLWRGGMLGTPSWVGKDAFGRLRVLSEELAARHRRAALPRHWYSWAIAVDGAHRGKGLGAALMRQTFERARADRAACYLETTTESNVALHAKHGYRVLTDGKLPGTNLRVWTMLRDASAD